jgi:ankyrin repeat protein
MFLSGKEILERELDLRVASAKGDLNYVKYFMSTYKNSININSFSIEGKDEKQTALHLACENGHVDVAIVLIEHGANINAKGLGDDTPLHTAIIFGYLDVVQALLERGADPNRANDIGDTPIDYAEREGYDDIVVCLKGNSFNQSKRPYLTPM